MCVNGIEHSVALDTYTSSASVILCTTQGLNVTEIMKDDCLGLDSQTAPLYNADEELEQHALDCTPSRL